MAIRYIDSDRGLTGGSGTRGDPYGIQTAIAAAVAGDTFYWRGGTAGDVTLAGTLTFDKAGTAAAPISWIRTTNDWTPIPDSVLPHVGVDGNDQFAALIAVTGPYQLFQGLRAHNGLDGRLGAVVGWRVDALASKCVLRNLRAFDVAIGLLLASHANILFVYRGNDAGIGVSNVGQQNVMACCRIEDVDSWGFVSIHGCALTFCQALNCLNGAGFRLDRDALAMALFSVVHCSTLNCLHGIHVYSRYLVQGNTFTVRDCLFSACVDYAINVDPMGQFGSVLNNGVHNCPARTVPAGFAGPINEDWLMLNASPFRDPGAGDLSLVRSTPALSAATDGTDLGALGRRHGRTMAPEWDGWEPIN